MKALEKANTSWEQEQVMKITALYSTMYSFFEENIMAACRSKISHQFLFPQGHGHRKYNAYKRQFSVLANTSTLRFGKRAHKLTVPSTKRSVDTRNAKITGLANGNIFYNPLKETSDLRYSIAEIGGDTLETCILCGQQFKDIWAHYEIETRTEETQHVRVRVCGFHSFPVLEQSISVEVRRGARVGELKAILCKLLSVPTSRQQLSTGERILKNSEQVPPSEMVLREKKR